MRPFTIRPGDRLPHNTRNFTEPHKVLETKFQGPAIVITTTEGVFTFQHNEKVRFPMRPNQLSENFIAAEPPIPSDIAVNDILPPPVPGSVIEDPRTTPDWAHLDDATQKDYLEDYEDQCLESGEYQIVTSVTWPRENMAQVELLYARTGTMDLINVPSYDGVAFPAPTAKKIQERREYSPVERDFVKHGPYRSRQTERLVYFAVHPFGRGRWPSTIEVQSHNGTDLTTIRPPKTTAEWDLWKYEGDLNARHPNDPEQ